MNVIEELELTNAPRIGSKSKIIADIMECITKINDDLTLSMMDRKRKTQSTVCPQCDEHIFKYCW